MIPHFFFRFLLRFGFKLTVYITYFTYYFESWHDYPLLLGTHTLPPPTPTHNETTTMTVKSISMTTSKTSQVNESAAPITSTSRFPSLSAKSEANNHPCQARARAIPPGCPNVSTSRPRFNAPLAQRSNNDRFRRSCRSRRAPSRGQHQRRLSTTDARAFLRRAQTNTMFRSHHQHAGLECCHHSYVSWWCRRW